MSAGDDPLLPAGTRVLVTGAGSGLGRHLCQTFGGVPFVRGDRTEALDGQRFDVIVHCAANARFSVPASDAFGFVDDNILLTERLTRIPHGLFVFLSTVDLYPVQGGPWREDDPIALDRTRNPYGATKMLAEAIVRERCARSLILRPTTLLGPHARPNNIIRLLGRDDPALTLTADSRFNCVSHGDVAAFIAVCLAQDRRGTFNLGRAGDITLAEVAELAGRRPVFGSIRYTVPKTDITRASALLPALHDGSAAVVRSLAREMGAVPPGEGRRNAPARITDWNEGRPAGH